jgi:hypothetical protein
MAGERVPRCNYVPVITLRHSPTLISITGLGHIHWLILLIPTPSKNTNSIDLY